jgi:hypothetical protein
LPEAEAIGFDGVNPLKFAIPIPLSPAYDASSLRAAARMSKDAGQTRRLLALAAICSESGGTMSKGSATKNPELSITPRSSNARTSNLRGDTATVLEERETGL